jgi:hypothetical protein
MIKTIGLPRRKKFEFSYNQRIKTSVQFFQSGPGFIRELFDPHDLGHDGDVFDGKIQNITFFDRNLTIYFNAQAPLRHVDGTGHEISVPVRKIEGDLPLHPRLPPPVGGVLCTEYKPTMGAGVGRLYVRGIGTLTAFRAEYF